MFLRRAIAVVLFFNQAVVGRQEPEYDYIIVGGGTAGTALATRLSQYLPSSSILLLEAGPAADASELRIEVPGLRGSALFSEYDWNYTSTPQPALGGRRIDVNRGKVLGGTSALNYLCYDRASSEEYDAWGGLVGAKKRWNWSEMLKAMKRVENYTGDWDLVKGGYHGKKGPIRNLFGRIVFEQLKAWIPALVSLGIPHNEESMGGDNVGVMFQETNINPTHWTRSYGANSYVPLAGNNLVVKTKSHVVKVLFQEGSHPLKAVGVELDDGTIFPARKEVILSAGTINSPQLLEASGIGQSKVLKAAGIKLLLELPGVGENYQDHIRIGTAFHLKDNYTSFDPFIYDQENPIVAESLQLWLDGKVSLLDYTSLAYAFVPWDMVLDNDAEEELLRVAKISADMSNPVDRTKLKWLKNSKVPKLEVVMEANYVGAAPYPGGAMFTLLATIMHPFSRGRTHISPNATHPAVAPPVIDVNYLSNPYDLAAIIHAAKVSRLMAKSEPLRSVWTTEYEPGEEGTQTDEEWEAFVRRATLTFYHPVGTCAMLKRDEGGVVDGELRVYGTVGLRVVDASVMSVLISGHIQTAVYGIAEIAAAMIAEEVGLDWS